QKHVCLG
uniref:Uncharacterized protein n=1 Tax=Sinocyclocheilus rhinocerous TaxID=307959 RepID=A0A673GE20_9TELE